MNGLKPINFPKMYTRLIILYFVQESTPGARLSMKIYNNEISEVTGNYFIC